MISNTTSISHAPLSHVVLSTYNQQNSVALREVLEARALVCVNVPTVDAVADAIATEAALVVMTEEILADTHSAKLLSECLNAQPDWSDIPIIILLKDCQRFSDCLSLLSNTSHHRSVLLLELPLKRQAFAAIVRSCLQNRQRQYVLRDTLLQLEQSNQALENFSYTAAHELRNPLGAVTSSLDLLARAALTEDKQRQLIEIGLRTAKNMNRTIEALLNYGKVQAETENFALVDMNEVLKVSVEGLQALLEERQAQVKWSDLPVVYGSRQLLIQLVSNLVKNAVVHNDAEVPQVTISAESKSSNRDQFFRWLFLVSDNGPGISPKAQEGIFRMFNRASNSQADGSGIGLALCRRIVELHHGEIGVRSQLGKGSTFYFDLEKADV